MAIFIELVTDAFESVFREQANAQQHRGGGSRSSRAGKTVVRRPVRGIEIKDDTYAYIKVVRANGIEVPLLDSSSNTGMNSKGYTNFILQSVTEQRMEKHQIVETFGDSYVFFFGESPRFLDCQAVLINTHDFSWRAEWWENYENLLRGTKLVEQGARCYMTWDDIVVEGYMLQASAAEQSEQPYTVSLQFRFFVTKYQNIGLHQVEQFPIRQSVSLPPGVELTQADAFDKLQAFYRGGPGGTRRYESVVREQSVLASQLTSGGYGVGPLAQNAPVVNQLGPGGYSFGGASAGLSAGLGIGVGVSAGIGFGASAGASVGIDASIGAGAGIGTTNTLGIGIATGPLGSPRLGMGYGWQSGAAYAPFQTITQKIRDLPPSMVVDPAIWNALRGTTGLAGIEEQNILEEENSKRGALRGLIAENIDEYINGNDGYPGMRAYMGAGNEAYNEPFYRLNEAITRAQSLSFGLPYSIITTLNALGVSADNAYVMRDMGLAPNFSAGYNASVGASVGFGLSAGVSVGTNTSFGGSSGQSVSYSPLSNSSYGIAAGAGIGLSAIAGYYANTDSSSRVYASPDYPFRDPLGAIYGNSTLQTNSFNADAYRYAEGYGNPSFGYRSPYGGVGYGRAGFGDFGGTGFGASNAFGDPGFRNPMAVNASSMTSVSRPQYDMTSLTPGPSFGTTAVLGSASIHVGGVSTGFSMTAYTGSFDPWVITAARAQAPLYGQPAAGPGFSGAYQPNIGYAAYQQNQLQVSQPYMGGGVVAQAQASTSFGFF